jgi:hypothetical protein
VERKEQQRKKKQRRKRRWMCRIVQYLKGFDIFFYF